MSQKESNKQKLIVDNSPPQHLTDPLQYGDAIILKSPCRRCQSTNVPASKGNPLICIQCERALNDRYALERRDNDSWQELAAQQGVELWERQPNETQTEWMIWQTYCSYYPGRVPPYSQIAKELSVSLSMVTQSAQRWNYKVRLLSWSRYADAITISTRVDNVKAMNDKRIEMAQRIDDKISKAIDIIDVGTLKPNELVSLLKLSNEMERQAQTYVAEAVPNNVVETKTSDQRQTKKEDVTDILDILGKAGLMELISPSAMGVRQVTTTTTETQVIVKGENDG